MSRINTLRMNDNAFTHDPLLEVSPDEPDRQPEGNHICYAVRQHHDGNLDVCIVDTKEAARILDESRHVAVDGTVYWRNMPEEARERLFVELDVDVDPTEVETYKIASDREGGHR